MATRAARWLLCGLVVALVGCPAAPSGTGGDPAGKGDGPRKRGLVQATPSPGGTDKPGVAGPIGSDLVPIAPAGPTPGPEPRPSASAAPGATPPPTLAPADPFALASLRGVVRAPATIIGNNGGSLISDRGGGIIGNNGGSLIGKTRLYRTLAAAEQRPLAGASVRLLDAAGKPVLAADGTPAVAITDEQGRYGFSGTVPPRNMILEVGLPEGRGAVQAVVANVRGGARDVDLDLISTLTTAYIVEQYVRPQAIDPQITLDKLPLDVEAVTRARTAAAFEASGTVPPDLTPAQAVATVTALRQKDAALDGQLEAVRKLLVVAGQSDLGSGRPGTEIVLDRVEGLRYQADGSLLILDAGRKRIWRQGTDGIMRAVVGGQASAVVEAAGGATSQVEIVPDAMITDGAGRLLVLQRSLTSIFRIEPGGRIVRVFEHARTPLPASLEAVFHGPGEDVFAFLADGSYWRVPPGQAPVKLHTFDHPDLAKLKGVQRFGQDGLGKLYVYSQWGFDRETALCLDPVAKTVAPIAPIRSTTDAIDELGNVYEYQFGGGSPAGKLHVRTPDGTTRTFASDLDSRCHAAALSADGAAAVLTGKTWETVHRVADQVATLVAGKVAGVLPTPGGSPTATPAPGAPTPAPTLGPVMARDFAFVGPSLVALAPAGGLLVADDFAKRLYRVAPDGAVTLFAGKADSMEHGHGDGGPAVDAALYLTKSVCADAAGNLYLEVGGGNGRIRKIDPGGTITTFHVPARPAGGRVDIGDVVVHGGEVVAVLTVASADGSRVVKVVRIDAQGVEQTPPLHTGTALSLATAPDGSLYVVGDGKLWRKPVGGALTELDTEAAFDRVGSASAYSTGRSMAVDAKGRVYLALDAPYDYVARWSPATGTVSALAGNGVFAFAKGEYFNGSGVDDGLAQPMKVVFDAAGNLYIADHGNKQIKQIPAALLEK